VNASNRLWVACTECSRADNQRAANRLYRLGSNSGG